MKALSIQQPWSYAITHGTKRVENRTWYTSYRGRFLIHAGKTYQTGVEQLIHLDSPEVDIEGMLAAPRGALVGAATLVDCVRFEHVPAGQEIWSGGPWCFVLADVVAFADPIPWRGERGFFEVAINEEMPEHEADDLDDNLEMVALCGGAKTPEEERAAYERAMRGEA